MERVLQVHMLVQVSSQHRLSHVYGGSILTRGGGIGSDGTVAFWDKDNKQRLKGEQQVLCPFCVLLD